MKACPFCGSTDELAPRNEETSIAAPFGPPRTNKTTIWSCHACGENLYYSGQDEMVEANWKESETIACQRIMAELEKVGMSVTTTLLALRMPLNLIGDWKQGKFTPEAAGLLRCLKVLVLIPAKGDQSSVEKAFRALKLAFEDNTTTLGPN